MAKQAISGVVWSSVQRFGTMILSFVLLQRIAIRVTGKQC